MIRCCSPLKAVQCRCPRRRHDANFDWAPRYLPTNDGRSTAAAVARPARGLLAACSTYLVEHTDSSDPVLICGLSL